MSDIEIQELYASSYRRLLGQLIAVTGSVAEAEDVVQEAFVRGLDRHRLLLGADNPEAWLRTVAVNLARSRWRRAQRLLGLAPRLVELPRDGDTDHLVLGFVPRLTWVSAGRSLARCSTTRWLGSCLTSPGSRVIARSSLLDHPVVGSLRTSPGLG